MYRRWGRRSLEWIRRSRRGKVKVIGADETVVRLKGEKMVVWLATDAESGESLGMDVLLARDSDGFVRWLSGYVGELEAMVSDDLSTYKPSAERLGVDRQVCLAHVRKNVSRRLNEIEGWDRDRDRLWILLIELDCYGGRELIEMERRARGCPDLRRLVEELCGKWPSLLCHKRVRGVAQTNNCTERVIGGSKIIYKTIMGYEQGNRILIYCEITASR